MNTFEAIFSFLVLLSLLPFFMVSNPETSDNTSHYNLKIAEDIWRVLYLKGDLENFNKQKLNQDADKITELTSLCVEIKEQEVASCLTSKNTIAVKKAVFINGAPEIITLFVGVE